MKMINMKPMSTFETMSYKPLLLEKERPKKYGYYVCFNMTRCLFFVGRWKRKNFGLSPQTNFEAGFTINFYLKDIYYETRDECQERCDSLNIELNNCMNFHCMVRTYTTDEVKKFFVQKG